MNILLISHRFLPDIGGIESISEILADELSKKHNIRLITWSSTNTKDNKNYEIIRNPKLIRLISQFIWADVILENNPSYRLSWPNILFRKPNVTGLQTWIQSADGSTSLAHWGKRLLLNLADNVVACSDAIRQKIFPKAIVIGNPYNHHSFKRITSIEKTEDFVFLGRLVSDKGADMAIEAIAKLNEGKTFDSWCHLSIIGDGDEKEKLEKEVLNLNATGFIHFRGAMRANALVEELNKYRYLLIPSRWEEPFGIVALEGMACGCIPIVSDGGGLPDAVGDAGVIFKRNNSESLLKTIQHLLSDKTYQVQLQQNAEPHLQKHRSESVARQYLELLEAIVIK